MIGNILYSIGQNVIPQKPPMVGEYIPAGDAEGYLLGVESRLDYILDFLASIGEFVSDVVKMFAEALVGIGVLMENVAKFDGLFDIFTPFFPSFVWTGVVSIISIVVTLLVWKIVSSVVG